MSTMSPIIPAVIPRSAEHLIETLAVLSFSTNIHIDLVDGRFAVPASWPYEPLGSVSDIATAIESFTAEVHLMVESPIEMAYQWLDAGAKTIIFQLESVESMKEVRELKAERGCTIGMSIGNDTLTSELTKHIDACDFVQVMGIRHVGAQGQVFDTRSLIRIRELRALYPDLVISVDGSVNEETLPQFVAAGANRFVVGSAILQAEDPQQAFTNLTALAAKV